VLQYYLKQAMTASFQILSNSPIILPFDAIDSVAKRRIKIVFSLGPPEVVIQGLKGPERASDNLLQSTA
jgi:hypothetical protein